MTFQCQIHLKIAFIFSILFAILIYYYNSSDLIKVSSNRTYYDYIIVGAGTSGCVIASKLSENLNKSVLLIEAGDYFNYLTSVPLLVTLFQQTKYDWAFKSEPQKYSSFGFYDQKQLFPRGKGLGGSNQINYMVHGVDIKEELENWKSSGILNWNYDELLKIFQNKSIFKTTNSESELGNLFFEAIKELNQKNLQFIMSQNLIKDGQRWSTYYSHLYPHIKRENLHILLNTHVTKIIFNNNYAIGVEILDKNNKKHIIRNNNEVILSAGVFNSPQILFLSGIGPSYMLNRFKIPIIVDLPGVGRNLHDHLNMPIYVSITKPISLTMDKVLRFLELWNYLIYKKGCFATTPNNGFVRNKNFGILLFSMGSTDEKLLKNIVNLNSETFEQMFPFHRNSSREGFVFLATCLKPESRGYVSLKSLDPRELVAVNPRYLLKKKDIDCMIGAIKLIRRIINTKVFKNIGATINWPLFPNCHKPKNSNEYFDCIIRYGAMTGHHLSGTCKIGTTNDKFAVVDVTLKVKGISRLRIVDASILPEALPTFPNTFLVGVAEYAANMIQNEEHLIN